MTEAIDARTLEAQRHLLSMMARGVDGDSICADMKTIGWPPEMVLNTIYAVLQGATVAKDITPTQRAVIVLAGMAVEDAKATGGWRLRGRSASTQDIIRAANVVLKNFSMPLIAHPGIEPLGELAS